MALNIPEECRQQISDFLPDAIRAALTSYQDFVTKPAQDGGTQESDFKNYHLSCKAAVAHIELLLKLARMTQVARDADASPATPNASAPAILQATMGAAEEELARYMKTRQNKI